MNNKKGLIRGLFIFVAFIVATILLILLIKNEWDVNAAFGVIIGWIS